MIVDPAMLLAFVPVALALNLTPGADMMFCLGQGLRGGPRAAIAASAGISLGSLVHVTLAGLGLGAAMAAAPWTFEVIRWIGVAYLLWLAFQMLRPGPGGADARPPLRPARAFRDGLLVNLANPKVILFVLALVPQFVVATRPVLPQFLIFGAVLGIGGFFVNGAVGVFAGRIGRGIAGSAGYSRWLGRVTAAIFVALAARLALLQRV